VRQRSNLSINIIVAIAGICLIDLCYIFVIDTQQDATQRDKIRTILIVGEASAALADRGVSRGQRGGSLRP
jgi:hypothetical protein